MHIRGKAKKFAAIAGTAGMVGAGVLAGPLAGVAAAASAVTAPGPAADAPGGAVGPYTDGQFITVSGTGFSTRASGNTISIVECSDPSGLVANQAADNTTCDGSTINPLAIVPTASGGFTAQYQITKLNVSSGNAIDCDATHYCDLWIGEDFNGNFTGSSAQPVNFSAPFLINSTPPTPESPLTIGLPIAAAGVVGTAGFLFYRRRRGTVTA